MFTKKRINPVVLFLAFFFLNVFAYHNALHNDLRYDQPVVYKGSEIPNFVDRVKFAFLMDGKDGPIIAPKLSWFRPIPFLISWELYRLADGQLIMINFVNIILLSIIGLMLFKLLHFLFDLPVVALVAAVLFCLHPVNGIYINYAPGGVHGFIVFGLMLASMHSFLLYIKEEREIGMYFLSLVLFGAALMCHEIALFLPINIALTIHCLILKDRRRAYVLLLAFIFMSVVYLLERSLILGKGDLLAKRLIDLGIDPVIYAGTLVKVFTIYLGKLLSLQGIVINWCEPFLTRNLPQWLSLGSIYLVFFVSLLFIRRQGILAWALGLLFVGFIPVCAGGFSEPGQGLLFEAHWLFFTSTAYFVLVGWVINFLFVKWRRLAMGIFIGLVIFWLNVGWNYNNLYADEVKYARYYIQSAPGFRMAHIFLFQAYYKQGKYDQAREAILKARVGTRGDFGIYYYLACLDSLQGAYAQAEKDIQYSLMLYSENPMSYLLLGQIYEKQGRHDSAIDAYGQAAQLDPSLKKPGRN
jgi:tetratricopeptide (TPR) repeat protein